MCACSRRWRCSCFRGRIFARNPCFGVCVYDPAKTTVQYESARIILNVEKYRSLLFSHPIVFDVVDLRQKRFTYIDHARARSAGSRTVVGDVEPHSARGCGGGRGRGGKKRVSRSRDLRAQQDCNNIETTTSTHAPISDRQRHQQEKKPNYSKAKKKPPQRP